MRKLHTIFVVLGWSILAFSQTNPLPQTPIFQLTDDQIRQGLPSLQWVIEEGASPLSVEEIRQGQLKDGKVINIKAGEKTLLLETKSYWYQLHLQSEVPKNNAKLSVNFIGLDGGFIFTFKNVNAYTFINNQLVEEGISGLGIGRSKRDVTDIYEESMVKIDVNDQTSSEVWVNIRPYLNAEVMITNDVIANGGEHYYPKGAGSIPYPRPGWGDIMYYPSIGALAVFLLIGLFLFVWFREKVYGWFLTFILVNILAVWCIGFGNEFIHLFCPENPLIVAKYRELSDVLKFAVTLWFGRIFINTPKYFPKTDKVFVILILILPLASFSWVFFIGAGISTNNISGLAKGINTLLNLTSLFNLIILLYFIFSKNKLARIYSLGVILTFVGFFMVRSSINWVYQLAVLFIVLGSILALGLALVYRFKVISEERIQAEQEKKDILSNQNTLLEKEVKERTTELENVLGENQRLLHSILPEPIAEQIRQGQQTVVKKFEQVSILFADIVGFTVLSEKLSPQKVVDMLNDLFSKFDDLTDKYGLEKIKTIGDAYMVASGVPEEKDNHALAIFQFAQEMLQTIQTFNQAHNLTLAIRIGISSGPVVAGVIGKKKFAYDLWGDTVNTAARMEAYGQASCIQLSQASYELLKSDFEFEKIPNVEIKGKGLMDVYVWAS